MDAHIAPKNNTNAVLLGALTAFVSQVGAADAQSIELGEHVDIVFQ
jgi:hypothetical protein